MRRPFRRISNIVSEIISAKALPGRRGPYNEGPATFRRPPMDKIKPLFTATATATGARNGGGFGLAVKLSVQDKSLPQAELAALAREAHEQICPYSHATRNNVPVELEVSGA